MIYNVLVVFYNNKYIFDFSDFLLPQTPGATYMIHMTNSINYCNFFLFIIFFCLFMTMSLLFYDQIIFYLIWCILRLSRVNIFTFDKLTSALVICCRINFLIDVISYVTSNKHNISLKRLLISAIARPPYCNNIVNAFHFRKYRFPNEPI